MTESEPTVETQIAEVSPDYREYYVTAASGGFTPDDFRIDFSNFTAATVDDAGRLARVRRINVSAIMPRKHAMELGYWLIANVLKEEEKQGSEFPRSAIPTENLIKVIEGLRKFDLTVLQAQLDEKRKEESERTRAIHQKALAQARQAGLGDFTARR